MTLTLNTPHRELCAIQKAGGVAVDVAVLGQCCRVAAAKVTVWGEVMRDALAKADADASQRPAR